MSRNRAVVAQTCSGGLRLVPKAWISVLIVPRSAENDAIPVHAASIAGPFEFRQEPPKTCTSQLLKGVAKLIDRDFLSRFVLWKIVRLGTMDDLAADAVYASELAVDLLSTGNVLRE